MPPAGTVTDVPMSPLTATSTVLVLPSAISSALQVEPAGMFGVGVGVVAAGALGVDGQLGRKLCPVAADFDGDLTLLTCRRAGDGLGDRQ